MSEPTLNINPWDSYCATCGHEEHGAKPLVTYERDCWRCFKAKQTFKQTKLLSDIAETIGLSSREGTTE